MEGDDAAFLFRLYVSGIAAGPPVALYMLLRAELPGSFREATVGPFFTAAILTLLLIFGFDVLLGLGVLFFPGFFSIYLYPNLFWITLALWVTTAIAHARERRSFNRSRVASIAGVSLTAVPLLIYQLSLRPETAV
jgi:hypothetical protein